MVKITNGVDTFEVSRGAFDGIYSRQGFYLIDEDEMETKMENSMLDELNNESNINTNDEKENTPDSKSEPQIKETRISSDDIFLKEIVEMPISKWNKQDLKRFAKLKDLDIKGKSPADVKEIIKEMI